MSQSIKPFSFEEFKTMYSKVPRLCVEIVIIREKEVLLTHRTINPHKNQWHLPGGTVYFKESLDLAAKRVAKEELGVDVTIEKQLGIIEYLHEDENRGFDHPVSIVMQCHTESDNFVLDTTADNVAYFSTLPQNIVKEHKDFLKTILV